jgi:hypothetical protein
VRGRGKKGAIEESEEFKPLLKKENVTVLNLTAGIRMIRN